VVVVRVVRSALRWRSTRVVGLFQPPLELSLCLAEGAGELGELAAAEQDQDDDGDDQKVSTLKHPEHDLRLPTAR